MTSLALVLAAVLTLPIATTADGHHDDGPLASATVASAIAPDAARVSGTVRTGEKKTSYWFEYGTSPAYGHHTAIAQTHGDENEDTAVSALLTALPSATPHHVRLVAVSGKELAIGPDATFTTAAATVPPPVPADDPAPPALGETVVTTAVADGPIRVRPPGSAGFHVLSAAESIPVGSVIDARQGTVELRTASSAAGAIQTGRFRGSSFVVRQRRDGKGLTDLWMRGSFKGCHAGRSLAHAAAKRPRRVRKLWGSDHHGRFRTHGRDSVATVRGTRWSVTDRCDGTLTRVTAGAVDVRPVRGGRVVRVRAGHSHLVRHRR